MNAGLKRVDRLPGGVARLVDSVPDEDLTACLHLIVATVLDVTAVSTPSPTSPRCPPRDCTPTPARSTTT